MMSMPSTPRLVAALLRLALVGTVTACAGRTTEAGPAPAPPAGEARPLRLMDNDSAMAASLHASGVSVQGRRVTAWFPRDSMPESQMRDMVDGLDAAVPALQSFIGGPYPWQRLGDRRIVYYFAPGQFVAHTQDSAVFVALSRLRSGTAPLLHETVHVLAVPSTPYYPWELGDSAVVQRARGRHPLWFTEGYADYAAKAVAATLPFAEGDPLQTGTHAQVDSVCAARLRGPRGAEVARFVGAGGVLPSLFTTERREVAPTFYACGSSLTRFLAERTSPHFLASLFPDIIPGRFEDRIRERTGRPLAALRTEWLQRIGAPEFASSAETALDHDHSPAQGRGAVPRLGTVVFPNSGAAAAQEPFLRGIALLHSFEYADAADAFRQAQRADPGFALAYWGEALTHSHFLWLTEDLAAARATLARLAPTREQRLARAGNERERALGTAIETFLQDGQPLERARTFADATKAYADANPADVEAAAFAALGALVGGRLAPAEEARGRTEDAIAFAERVIAANPEHPGGAHYLIHATDSPRLAHRGLAAARQYDRIAPDADHALHMPSHIFLTLGMWDDMSSSNERAWAASRAWVAARGSSPANLSWHTLEWLQYAYLQQGRHAAARSLIDTAAAVLRGIAPESLAGNPDAEYTLWNLAYQYGAETGDWTPYPAKAPGPPTAAPGGTPSQRAVGMAIGAAYGAGVAAARRTGDTLAVNAAARFIRDQAQGAVGGRRAYFERMATLLEALVAQARGDGDAATALLRRAAEAERAREVGGSAVGPPMLTPPMEALGAALLRAGNAREAADAYESALFHRPNRTPALLGLARARRALGDARGAAEAYARVVANWHAADAGLADLAEARAGARLAGP